MVGCSGRWMRRDRTPRGRADHGDDQRGEPARALPRVGKSTTDLWRIPMVRTPRRHGPPGCGALRDARPACHDRRVMSRRRPPRRPSRWAATAIRPPAASTAVRPAPRSRRGPTGAGGTPPRRPTWPSTAPTSATPTSSGAPRGCGRPTPTCSGTSPGGGCWRSAAARRPARAGCGEPAPTSSPWTSPAGMLARAAELNRATGIDVPLLQADAGALPLADGARRRGLLGLRRAALRRRRRGRAGRGGPGAAPRRAVRRLGEPPDALAVPRLPRPRGPPGRRPPTSTAVPTSRPTTRDARSTSSTTAPSATGCGPSSAPGWCSRTWSSRSGRRAAPRTGASGRPSAAPSSPAR